MHNKMIHFELHVCTIMVGKNIYIYVFEIIDVRWQGSIWFQKWNILLDLTYKKLLCVFYALSCKESNFIGFQVLSDCRNFWLNDFFVLNNKVELRSTNQTSHRVFSISWHFFLRIRKHFFKDVLVLNYMLDVSNKSQRYIFQS